MTKVLAVKCPECNYTIFSRARHDFRTCACKGDKGIFVDGGLEYTRIGFYKEAPEKLELEIDATPQELYQDWNQRTNKYGRFRK